MRTKWQLDDEPSLTAESSLNGDDLSITTADTEGKIRAYVGEGLLTNDELKTFGNRAVANVPKLQKLMRHVCSQGFEHHVVMTQSHSAAILKEAFSNYFGWEVYEHEAPND